jgi:hypothetical protein
MSIEDISQPSSQRWYSEIRVHSGVSSTVAKIEKIFQLVDCSSWFRDPRLLSWSLKQLLAYSGNVCLAHRRRPSAPWTRGNNINNKALRLTRLGYLGIPSFLLSKAICSSVVICSPDGEEDILSYTWEGLITISVNNCFFAFIFSSMSKPVSLCVFSDQHDSHPRGSIPLTGAEVTKPKIALINGTEHWSITWVFSVVSLSSNTLYQFNLISNIISKSGTPIQRQDSSTGERDDRWCWDGGCIYLAASIHSSCGSLT